MIIQVRSNAIAVNPFNARKSIKPNSNQQQKNDSTIQKYLVYNKTADTLNSSITTSFHPQLQSEIKNLGVSSSNIDNYFDKKYFTPYRRFPEKKSKNMSLSPSKNNYIPLKVSSDFESYGNSIQRICNDQISVSYSITSNRDHQIQNTKMGSNSQLHSTSQINVQKNEESNQVQEIVNKEINQKTEEFDKFQPLENLDNNNIHKLSQFISSSNNRQQETFIKQVEDQQKQDFNEIKMKKPDSNSNIQFHVKQFRVQIEKTIILNQTQNYQQKSIQQQNIINQDETSQPQMYYQQQQEMQESNLTNLNQTKSQILMPQKAQQKFSTLLIKESRLLIRLPIIILIVILLIKICNPLV